MTKDERSEFVATEWANYQETKDRRYLAKIALEMPFFGHPEVGEEIAKLLYYSANLDQYNKLHLTAYKETRDRHWLDNMLRVEAFRDEPMGSEVSKVFAQSLLGERDKNQERDDAIITAYAREHYFATNENFKGKFSIKARRELFKLYKEEVKNEETLRSILRNNKQKILEYFERNDLEKLWGGKD